MGAGSQSNDNGDVCVGQCCLSEQWRLWVVGHLPHILQTIKPCGIWYWWLAFVILVVPFPFCVLQVRNEYFNTEWQSIQTGESYYFGNMSNFFLCAEPAYNISFAYAKLRCRNFKNESKNESGVSSDACTARPELHRFRFSDATLSVFNWPKADVCVKFKTSDLTPRATNFAEDVYSTKLEPRLFLDVTMENFGLKDDYKGNENYTDIYQGLDLWSDFGLPNSRQWLATVPISKEGQIQTFMISKTREFVLPPEVHHLDPFAQHQQREKVEIASSAVVGIFERRVPKKSPTPITTNIGEHIQEPPLPMSHAKPNSSRLSFAKVALTLSKHSVTVREQVLPRTRWVKIVGELGGLITWAGTIAGLLFARKYHPNAEFEMYEEHTVKWKAGEPMDFRPLIA